MYSFWAMNSFRMSFWMVPETLPPVGTLPLGHHQVHREDHRRRRVDRHRRRDVGERDAVEQRLHVGERRDRHAALPHLAERQRVVGVAAHQRGQVERHAEPGAAAPQQFLVAGVGVLRRAEPGELPHRPQLAAVARGMDAPRVGEAPRVVEVARVVGAGHVLRRVEPLDWPPGDRGVLPGAGCRRRGPARRGDRFHGRGRSAGWLHGPIICGKLESVSVPVGLPPEAVRATVPAEYSLAARCAPGPICRSWRPLRLARQSLIDSQSGPTPGRCGVFQQRHQRTAFWTGQISATR